MAHSEALNGHFLFFGGISFTIEGFVGGIFSSLSLGC